MSLKMFCFYIQEAIFNCLSKEEEEKGQKSKGSKGHRGKKNEEFKV